MEIMAFVLLLLCGVCLGQSGGGGSGGAIAGIVAVILCPCITCCLVVACIKSRLIAKKEKKLFLESVEPMIKPTPDRIIPIDGHYSGYFTQHLLSYDMHLDLHFHEKTSPSPNISLFKVKGKGHDEMGEFKISKGECALGNSAKLFFTKKYISMKSGYTNEKVYKLIYKGEMQLQSINCIEGEWTFAGKEATNSFPHVSGTFKLECYTPNKAKESLITIDNTLPPTPNYLQPSYGAIDLEKVP